MPFRNSKRTTGQQGVANLPATKNIKTGLLHLNRPNSSYCKLQTTDLKPVSRLFQKYKEKSLTKLLTRTIGTTKAGNILFINGVWSGLCLDH